MANHITRGSSTTIDRFRRLVDVYKYDDGTRTAKDIAEIVGIPESSVKQARKNIKELLDYGVSPESLNDRRLEFYLEYCEQALEAKKLFEKYRDADASAVDIKRFFMAWVDVTEKKVKLFGLDGMRVGEVNFNQFNQQNNQIDVVESKVGKRIADIIKEEHQRKLIGKEEVVDV